MNLKSTSLFASLLVISLTAAAQVKGMKNAPNPTIPPKAPKALNQPAGGEASAEGPTTEAEDPLARELDQPEIPRLEGKVKRGARDFRAQKKWTALAQLSTASLLIPLRPGVSLSWNRTPEWSYEASYMTGSLSAGVAGQDIASFAEKSLLLRARYFGSSNSFHYIVGLSRETGDFRLGNKYLNMVTGAGDISLAKFSSLAVNLGLGNRWQWENGLSFGVDWATLILPLSVQDTNSDYFQTNASAADKQSLRDTLDIIAKFPRFAFLTVSAGWSF